MPQPLQLRFHSSAAASWSREGAGWESRVVGQLVLLRLSATRNCFMAMCECEAQECPPQCPRFYSNGSWLNLPKVWHSSCFAESVFADPELCS